MATGIKRNNMERNKKHWENVFSTKKEEDFSWYQQYPATSMQFIKNCQLPLTAKIIDIGGGDSYLVDALLNEGYQNISVLDISQKAIERAKLRLGNQANKINWIVSDITEYKPTEKFDLWHDRAAFHFLTEKNVISKYLKIANESIIKDGHLVMGTFSENGPKICSGLTIKQYSEKSMNELFASYFEKVYCIEDIHTTPFKTQQNFTFCRFKNKSNVMI